jgi:hypothetical protein
MENTGWNVRIVDSWPPRRVADDVNTEATFVTRAPRIDSPSVWSRRVFI